MKFSAAQPPANDDAIPAFEEGMAQALTSLGMQLYYGGYVDLYGRVMEVRDDLLGIVDAGQNSRGHNV